MENTVQMKMIEELQEELRKLKEEDRQQKEELRKLKEELESLKTWVRADGDESKRTLLLSVSEVAKDSKLRAEFRENQVTEDLCRGGFIAQQFYLDFVLAAREFEEFKEKDDFVKQVAKLGEVLKKRVEHSLFTNGYLDEEAPQSAVGSELFRLAIDLLQRMNKATSPEPLLRVTHQQHLVTKIGGTDGFSEFDRVLKRRKMMGSEKAISKSGEGKKSLDQIDICAWFVHPDERLGACILAACEYKPNNFQERERKAQADMYGSNILILHQKQCIVIDIAGSNDLASWKVSAYGLVEAEFSRKPHSWEKSPLYHGQGAEAIVMVARGLLAAQKSFPSGLRQYGSRLGPVVGEIDGYVYKVYDNAQYRKPNIDVVQLLLDEEAELLKSKDENIQIVKMKRIQSDWKQEVKSDVFLKIINDLKILHEKFGPHGDIRLANLLSCGNIIDFDFVGAERYPATFNSVSQDGKRHEDVEEMIVKIEKDGDETSLIQPEKTHDWFSLGQVMRLFEPSEPSNAFSWTTLCDQVERAEEATATSYNIKLKDVDIPLRGTGHTPVKKQPGTIRE